MEKLKLVTVWESVHIPKDKYVSMHHHDDYELVYYCTGKGHTRIGNEDFEFKPGRFVLIPPEVKHDQKHIETGSLVVIRFICRAALPFFFLDDKDGVVQKIGYTILEESLAQKTSYKEMIEAKLNELLVVITRMREKMPQRAQARNFEYVINYLAESYHEKIVLRDFATQMNFSYDYFQHRFKALTGVSPRQYLIGKRVHKACELLREGETCTNIAYRCGFSNSAQFTSIFKREVGMTPTQYQKICRKGAEEDEILLNRDDLLFK